MGVNRKQVVASFACSTERNVSILPALSPIAGVSPTQAAFGGQAQRGWVEVLAATQTPTCARWSTGSADAVRWHLQTIFDTSSSGTPAPTDLLVLSGQALYNMVS